MRKSEPPPLDHWYEGHIATARAVERVTLSPWQRIELAFLVTLIGIIRPFYWLYRRVTGRPFAVASGLDELRNTPCEARGNRNRATHGGDYLTSDQVEKFERDGYVEPFALLTADQAAELREFMVTAHDADWFNQHMITKPIADALKRSGLWSIKQGSLWQEHNRPEIRRVALLPSLAERAASLLGDDVVAWRTQVFAIPSQSRGTFWHSATTFTEDGDLPTLSAPEGVAPALTNLNAWIALEDVDETNSCLQIVPGTHVDARLDTMLRRFMADRIGFVMTYRRRERRQALIAIRYSGDLFLASQLGFEMAMSLAPDMYESLTPTPLVMKAGECVMFSSNALHCSFLNQGSERLAMGVRITSADVGIYEDQEVIPFATGGGDIDLSTAALSSGTTLHTTNGAVGHRVIDLREPAPKANPVLH